MKKGIVNLEKHIENLQKYHVPVVVTLNSFVSDTEAEVAYIENLCKERGCEFALSEVWEKGGEGGLKLAEEVIRLCDEPNDFHYCYEEDTTIQEKLDQIVQKVYGEEKLS